MRSTQPVVLALSAVLLTACASDPWIEWPVADATMSDLAITRVAWDQGEGTEPGPGGQPRYAWAVDIQNTSTTIWSGRVRIITEVESGGQVYADTLSDRVVIPGRRLVTATNFGRLAAGASGKGLTPRFLVRIGAYCATVQGAVAEAGPCPEEAEAAPTDVGPPIG